MSACGHRHALIFKFHKTMKPTLIRKLFFLSAFFVLTIAAVKAQEPYTGGQVFNVGDLVEATELGEWKKAVVVGPLQTNEFGSTYEIKFEGAKYSAGRISSKWVRPRANATTASTGRQERNVPTRPGPKAGEVLYRNGTYIWNTGAKIESYDERTRQYRLRFDSGSGDIVPCHSVATPGQIDNTFYVGNWAVFVSGATSTFERGGDLYRRYSSGMASPPLQIKADGTYTWRADNGRVIQGRWSPRDGVPGITIHKGLDGKDWTVYESTEGYAPTAKTMDEIRFHHIPTSTGYYMAKRIGSSKSCVLRGRTF